MRRVREQDGRLHGQRERHSGVTRQPLRAHLDPDPGRRDTDRAAARGTGSTTRPGRARRPSGSGGRRRRCDRRAGRRWRARGGGRGHDRRRAPVEAGRLRGHGRGGGHGEGDGSEAAASRDVLVPEGSGSAISSAGGPSWVQGTTSSSARRIVLAAMRCAISLGCSSSTPSTTRMSQRSPRYAGSRSTHLGPRLRRRLGHLGVDLRRTGSGRRAGCRRAGRSTTTSGTPRSRQRAPICFSACRAAIQPGASSAYIDL